MGKDEAYATKDDAKRRDLTEVDIPLVLLMYEMRLASQMQIKI